MKKIAWGFIALLVFINGCSSTQNTEAMDRHSLKSVKINTSIKKPPEMFYLGSGIGFMFGAIGGVITAIAQESPGKSFQTFAESNNIYIENIVLDEANNALNHSERLSSDDDQDAPTLYISIFKYGFSIPNGFSSKLVPIVGIECSLIDKSGKTIWSSSASVSTVWNPAEAHSLEDLKSNPKLIEESWRVASKATIDKIVKSL